jgi:hypothetical protein
MVPYRLPTTTQAGLPKEWRWRVEERFHQFCDASNFHCSLQAVSHSKNLSAG